MKQLNLKMPDNFFVVAERYVNNYGFRNIQELALASMREKIFEKNEFDENFSEKEINLIDELIAVSVKKKDIVSERELNKILLG